MPDVVVPTAASTGKAPQCLDDDELAHLTEEERVEAGVEGYDAQDVPPATDWLRRASRPESGSDVSRTGVSACAPSEPEGDCNACER